jgi:hypothetical protein
MKTFTTTDTSAHDLVHIVGSKDDYTITENGGSITYTSESWQRTYVVSGNEQLSFKRPDSQGKTNFKWNEEFAPFDLQPFGNIVNVNMPHSGINVIEAGSNRITANGYTAVSDGNVHTYGQFALHDGHDGAPGDWPAYIAIDLGNAEAVNRLKLWIHVNSIGNFKLQGSNDAGTGDFYNQGTWTDIPFVSSSYSTNYQNAGGYGSGISDNTSIEFTYNNDAKYRYYRLDILDVSNPGSSGLTEGIGWANYGWELYRA